MNSPSERWRPVVGYEGLYEVSDFGRVRSLDRLGPTSRGNGVHKFRGRALKPFPRNGYLDVTLSRNNRTRIVGIHRLVLEAFVGPCPDGMEACHGPDPERSNCRLENLRWDTKSSNQKDRLEQDARDYRGSANGNAHLVETDIERIFDLRRTGCRIGQIAYWINTSRSNVSLILNGKAWRHARPA